MLEAVVRARVGAARVEEAGTVGWVVALGVTGAARAEVGGAAGAAAGAQAAAAGAAAVAGVGAAAGAAGGGGGGGARDASIGIPGEPSNSLLDTVPALDALVAKKSNRWCLA